LQIEQIRRDRALPAQVAAVAVALFVALMLAGTFGFWLGGLSSSDRPTTIAPLAAIGGDRIAHNRAEQEFGPSGSAGGEQIAHNRSEEGFTQ